MSDALRDIVRRRRLEMGLTQVELAERTEMSQEWLSGVERGKVKSPPVATLQRLAKSLQVPVESLVIAAGYATTRGGALRVVNDSSPDYDTADPDAEPLPAHLRASFLKLETMTPERRQRIIELIEDQAALDEIERERLRRDEGT